MSQFPSITFYHGDKTTLAELLPLTDKGAGATLGWRTQQFGNVIWMMWNADSADGVTFNRDDTGQRAFAQRRNADGTVNWLEAAAAANPITWTTIFTIDRASSRFLIQMPNLDFSAGAASRLGTDDDFDLYFRRNAIMKVTIGTAGVTFVDPLLAPAGAVGAPAYSFSADATLGLYRPAANQLAVAIAGAQRIFLKDTLAAIGFALTPDTVGAGLHLRTEGSANRLTDMSYATTDANGWLLRFMKLRGSHASPSAVIAGDVLGDVQFHGHTGSALYLTALIRVTPMETFSGTAGGADIEIWGTRTAQQTLRKRLAIFGGITNAFDFSNADGTLIARLTHTAASGDTVLVIGNDGGGGFRTSTVTLGATDSGGAGFKLLRVPN